MRLGVFTGGLLGFADAAQFNVSHLRNAVALIGGKVHTCFFSELRREEGSFPVFTGYVEGLAEGRAGQSMNVYVEAYLRDRAQEAFYEDPFNGNTLDSQLESVSKTIALFPRDESAETHEHIERFFQRAAGAPMQFKLANRFNPVKGGMSRPIEDSQASIVMGNIAHVLGQLNAKQPNTITLSFLFLDEQGRRELKPIPLDRDLQVPPRTPAQQQDMFDGLARSRKRRPTMLVMPGNVFRNLAEDAEGLAADARAVREAAIKKDFIEIFTTRCESPWAVFEIRVAPDEWAIMMVPAKRKFLDVLLPQAQANPRDFRVHVASIEGETAKEACPA